MDACDICQYLISQNMFCTIMPIITLANISSCTVTVLGIRIRKYLVGPFYQDGILIFIGYNTAVPLKMPWKFG